MENLEIRVEHTPPITGVLKNHLQELHLQVLQKRVHKIKKYEGNYLRVSRLLVPCLKLPFLRKRKATIDFETTYQESIHAHNDENSSPVYLVRIGCGLLWIPGTPQTYLDWRGLR